MGKTTGFIEFQREAAPYRDANERLLDFRTGDAKAHRPKDSLRTLQF